MVGTKRMTISAVGSPFYYEGYNTGTSFSWTPAQIGNIVVVSWGGDFGAVGTQQVTTYAGFTPFVFSNTITGSGKNGTIAWAEATSTATNTIYVSTGNVFNQRYGLVAQEFSKTDVGAWDWDGVVNGYPTVNPNYVNLSFPASAPYTAPSISPMGSDELYFLVAGGQGGGSITCSTSGYTNLYPGSVYDRAVMFYATGLSTPNSYAPTFTGTFNSQIGVGALIYSRPQTKNPLVMII
jgi:hypothetical protein